MGESHQHHNYPHLHHQLPHHHPPTHHPQPPVRSRLGGLRGIGEIVEVQGGHIVRSTGRKDRHSKVFTAKGPRDRRVRLSAHTAIQFYDVQDRLGYDRPSKAVDWLIKNAKAAIDELAVLPPWHPTAPASSSNPHPPSEHESLEPETAETVGESGKTPLPEAEPVAPTDYGFGTSSILPPSLDSDAIADTIKSFFPLSATTGASTSSPPIGFQSYAPDLLSRTSNQGQDLRLSLHPFQDPILLHYHTPSATRHTQSTTSAQQALFSSSSTALNFDASSVSWSEQHERMDPWNAAAAAEAGVGGGGGGYIFTVSPPQAVPLHPVLGHSSFLSQRGPLQSSSSPHVRALTDTLAADHPPHAVAAMHQMGPSVSAIGFAAGGFSGFYIPARIQGEEENDGVSNKPSSASCASRH